MSCEYCAGNKPLHDYGEQELRIVDGWTNSYGEVYPGWQMKYRHQRWLDCHFETYINFCPMCGRELLGGDAE